jgi:hypothetical protein
MDCGSPTSYRNKNTDLKAVDKSDLLAISRLNAIKMPA